MNDYAIQRWLVFAGTNVWYFHELAPKNKPTLAIPNYTGIEH